MVGLQDPWGSPSLFHRASLRSHHPLTLSSHPNLLSFRLREHLIKSDSAPAWNEHGLGSLSAQVTLWRLSGDHQHTRSCGDPRESTPGKAAVSVHSKLILWGIWIPAGKMAERIRKHCWNQTYTSKRTVSTHRGKCPPPHCDSGILPHGAHVKPCSQTERLCVSPVPWGRGKMERGYPALDVAARDSTNSQRRREMPRLIKCHLNYFCQGYKKKPETSSLGHLLLIDI